jgi:hypothetical protein
MATWQIISFLVNQLLRTIYFMVLLILILKAYTKNENPIALNYNQNGILDIQLPQGPTTDSYRQYIFVNIIDDSNGIAVFTIDTPVVVTPNDALVSQLLDSLLSSSDVSSQFMLNLNSGNLNLISKNIIGLSSVLNTQQQMTSTSDNTSSNVNSNDATNRQMASVRELMVEKLTQFNASDLSSVKVLASTLSVTTKNSEQITTRLAVRK